MFQMFHIIPLKVRKLVQLAQTNFPVFHKHGPCVPRAMSYHSNVKTKEKLGNWAKNHSKGYT